MEWFLFIIVYTLIPLRLSLCSDTISESIEKSKLKETSLLLPKRPAHFSEKFFQTLQEALFGNSGRDWSTTETGGATRFLEKATVAFGSLLRNQAELAQKFIESEVEGIASGATTSIHVDALNTLLSTIAALVEAQTNAKTLREGADNAFETTPFDDKQNAVKNNQLLSINPVTQPVLTPLLLAPPSVTYVSSSYPNASVINPAFTPYSLQVEPPAVSAMNGSNLLNRPILKQTILPIDQANAWRTFSLFAVGISNSYGHVPSFEEQQMNDDFLYSLLIIRYPYSPEIFAGLALDTLAFVNATQRLQCPPRESYKTEGLAKMLLFRSKDTPEAFAKVMVDYFRIASVRYAHNVATKQLSLSAESNVTYRLPMSALSAPSPSAIRQSASAVMSSILKWGNASTGQHPSVGNNLTRLSEQIVADLEEELSNDTLDTFFTFSENSSDTANNSTYDSMTFDQATQLMEVYILQGMNTNEVFDVEITPTTTHLIPTPTRSFAHVTLGPPESHENTQGLRNDIELPPITHEWDSMSLQ